MSETGSAQHFANRVRVEKQSQTFFREAGRGKALVQIGNLVKFNPGLVLLMGDEGSGRSRILSQFAESLKGKTGTLCVLNRSIKNESHLYTALLEGFGLGHSGDNLETMKKAFIAFLESDVEAQKPIVIALDDVHHCSLAMLEALIALQMRFRATSLILVGDNTLQKMLDRLLGGKMSASVVALAPLDAREIRQYIHWRLPFTLPDLEMTNVITLSRGNMALLEQEANKCEERHQRRVDENAEHEKRKASGGKIFATVVALLLVAGGGFYLYRSMQHLEPSTAEALHQAPINPDAAATNAKAEPTIPATSEPARSSGAWVDKQVEWLGEQKSPAPQASPPQ